MKTMYQIKPTRQNLFSRNFLKITAVFLLILALVLTFNFSSSARSLVSNALSPLFKTGNFFYNNLNQVPKFFLDKNKLMAENQKLLDELENNRLDAIDYESVKYDNQKLRKELGLKPAADFISAAVIAKPPQIPLDSLFLDRGAEDGINKGDLVLVSERILIGKIVEVSKNKSTVALNSLAGAVSYGLVARTGEPLEIKGIGGGNIEAKVPIDFDIVVGDKIIVGNSFNYLVAITGVVEEDRSSGAKNILMSLPANISKTNIVFIRPVINE